VSLGADEQGTSPDIRVGKTSQDFMHHGGRRRAVTCDAGDLNKRHLVVFGHIWLRLVDLSEL
jgi:hypothetical protein